MSANVFSRHCFHLWVGDILRVGLLGHIKSSFNSLRSRHSVFHCSCTILISQWQCPRIPLLHIPANTCSVLCLFPFRFAQNSHPNVAEWHCILALICISLTITNADLVICLLAICIFVTGEVSIQDLRPFFNIWFFLLGYEFSVQSGYEPYQVYDFQVFFPFRRLPFYSVECVLLRTRFFRLM